MQINRLFEIVYILTDKKSMTAKALAEHFEVSVRTILRDINTLCIAGIPICTTQGRGGGISIMEGYVLNKSVLTDKEQSDILSALHSLNVVNVPDVKPVLNKLGALFNKNATAWIDIDFSPWDSGNGEREKFTQLKNAILDKVIVSFDYFNYWGEKTVRKAEPMQIVFKEKAWYLLAFCLIKNDFRTFKLSRIKNLEEVGDETFEPREFKRINENFDNCKLCTVTLKIDEEMAFRVWDEFEQKQIIQNDDGTFTVKALIPQDEWGLGYIMSYGEYVQVIEPEHIRKAIIKKLQQGLQKYS